MPDNPWSGSELSADAFVNEVMPALPHVVCTDLDGQAGCSTNPGRRVRLRSCVR